MDLYNCRLLVVLEPSFPRIIFQTGLDGPEPGAELAADQFYEWLVGKEGALLGVELMIGPDLGILEAHPGFICLPYVTSVESILPRIWFTDRRDGSPSEDEQNNWLSTFYTTPAGHLAISLGVHRLSEESIKQLIELCVGNGLGNSS